MGVYYEDKKASTSLNPLVVFAGLIVVLGLLYTVWLSTFLRPIADDYLVSAHSQKGALNATVYWYKNWSGDLISGINNSTLVGLPILHLDWSFSSAVPFWATLFILAASIWVTVSRITKVIWLSKWNLASAVVLVVSFVALMWIAFWWASPSLGGPDVSVAVSATMWQNVAVNYVFDQYLFIFLLLLSRFWKLNEFNRRHLFLASVIGVVAGLSGIVSGLALLVLCSVGFFTFRLANKSNTLDKQRTNLTFGCNSPSLFLAVVGTICAIGLYIAYTAPGIENRAGVEAELALQDKSFATLVNFVIPPSLSAWYDGISSIGNIIVLFMCAGVAAAFTRVSSIKVEEIRELQTIGVIFISASILESVLSRLAEAYSYAAYWHLVGPRSLMFAGTVFIGLAMGFRFSSAMEYNVKILCIPILISTSLLTLGSVIHFGTVVEERLIAWNLGPAPLFTVPDVEEAWRFGCYLEISKYQDSPKRSTESDLEDKYACLYF